MKPVRRERIGSTLTHSMRTVIGSDHRRIGSRVLGLIVLASLAADVALKSSANRGELMWACYWASSTLGVGLLAGSPILVTSGVIFFAGLGMPAWMVSVFMDRHVEITSVLIHVVPLVSGLYCISKASAIPKYCAAFAWLLFAIPFVVSWKLSDPKAMINLSHWDRWPVPTLLHPGWPFYGALAAVTFLMVNFAALVLNYALQRRALTAPAAPALAQIAAIPVR